VAPLFFVVRRYWSLGVFEQQIYRVPHSNDRGIGKFGRLSVAPTDRNLIDLYADAGVEFIGLTEKRPDDKFGIAAGYAHISKRAQQLDSDYRNFRERHLAATFVGRTAHCRLPISDPGRMDDCSRTSSTSSIRVVGQQLGQELFQANPRRMPPYLNYAQVLALQASSRS
jgi:hypothetical protein